MINGSVKGSYTGVYISNSNITGSDTGIYISNGNITGSDTGIYLNATVGDLNNTKYGIY